MSKYQPTLIANSIMNERILHMALELSLKNWKIGFSDGCRTRIVNVKAGDKQQVEDQIAAAKRKFGLPDHTRVVACYEAGREGFWIWRFLKLIAVFCLVIDSASIEVPRRRRHKKTDKVDVLKMLSMLVRHFGGEPGVFRTVVIPTEQDEDDLRPHRERNDLIKRRTQASNQIKACLFRHGIYEVKVDADLAFMIESFHDWKGAPLPENVRRELKRIAERWSQLARQIHEVEAEQVSRLRTAEEDRKIEMVRLLMTLKGVGINFSWVLVMEFFGWRKFRNGKQVGSLAGLTGTPFASGETSREQGISKVGNKRVRTLMIEAAWLWLRWLPESKISKWFYERFAVGKRMRRIGVVAVARKLLIAFWRLTEFGEVPAGAIFKQS